MPEREDANQFSLALPNDLSESSSIEPARLGRDEMNLAEFPFALLSDRAPKGINTVSFEDTVEGKDGKLVTRTWTVTGGESFGLPLAADEEVYVALMEVSKEQGFDQRTIYITRYDLIKRLGWPDKGDSYRRLRAALDRLLGVTVKAEKAFWDKENERYIDVGFHIIDDYALYDEAPGRKRKGAEGGQDALPLSFISWNQVIFRSIRAGNIKQLDTAFFFTLKSSLSRRLYRYLDKKRYDGKEHFRIGLKKLAFEKLGMSRNYYPSHIKQELRRAHMELLDNGFLRRVEYQQPHRRGEEQVVYYFTHRQYLISPKIKDVRRAGALVERLEDVGVTPSTAQRLVDSFGDEVRVQLQYLPYRSAQEPAAVLVEAIKGRWEPPASYLKARAEECNRVAATTQGAEIAELRANGMRDAELLKAAARAVFDGMSDTDQAYITQLVKSKLAKASPAVAQRPTSRAYEAMEQTIWVSTIKSLYRGDVELAFIRLRGERRLDLNDDL